MALRDFTRNQDTVSAPTEGSTKLWSTPSWALKAWTYLRSSRVPTVGRVPRRAGRAEPAFVLEHQAHPAPVFSLARDLST